MVKKVMTWWQRLLMRLDDWAEKRNQTWEDVVTSENKTDLLEIERARRAILNHQYKMYMAQAQMDARIKWLDMLRAQEAETRDAEFAELNIQPQASRTQPHQRTLKVVREHGEYAYPGSP